MRVAAVVPLSICLAAPVAAGPPEFSLPVGCTLGGDCTIEAFVDRREGPGKTDYRCGLRTRNDHTGVDFAVSSQKAFDRGIDVRATAPGIVRAVRDGMPDQGLASIELSEIRGVECGNGVAIRHADGWETLYCHLRAGSIQVRENQPVAAGDILGEIGMSGNSNYPHLHLTTRKNGVLVDPFLPDQNQTCLSDTSSTLWKPDIPYEPAGIFSTGFTTRIPDFQSVQSGRARMGHIPGNAPALVLFGFAHDAQSGDVMEFEITGPNGKIHARSTLLRAPKRYFFRASGRKLRQSAWAPGVYIGRVRLLRKNRVLSVNFTRTEVP